jgi:hypothetical protein
MTPPRPRNDSAPTARHRRHCQAGWRVGSCQRRSPERPRHASGQCSSSSSCCSLRSSRGRDRDGSSRGGPARYHRLHRRFPLVSIPLGPPPGRPPPPPTASPSTPPLTLPRTLRQRLVRRSIEHRRLRPSARRSVRRVCQPSGPCWLTRHVLRLVPPEARYLRRRGTPRPPRPDPNRPHRWQVGAALRHLRLLLTPSTRQPAGWL